MNFINYLSFKYKLTRHKPQKSRNQAIVERMAAIMLFGAATILLFFIIKLFPQNIQNSMNKNILGLFAFLCLLSIRTSFNKYYQEYFFSPEREILLIAPIKNSQIILSRFFVVSFEVTFINAIFLLTFTLANYFASNITIGIVLITIPQIVACSIFFTAIAHIVFAFAFIISKGKGLKTVAYLLMIFASVSITVIIMYLTNYKSFLLTQNKILEHIFYFLFQYPKYLLINKISYQGVGVFTVFTLISALFFILPAFLITNYCYNKGLISVSLRDLEKPYYSNKVSVLLHKYIKNYFLKKDVLYLIRSPKLFSVYISPLLFTSVIEFRTRYASSDFSLSVFINILAVAITIMTLKIIMSDDIEHQDLLFSIPFNIEELFKKRSALLHTLSFLIAGIYLFTISILESVRLEMIIYGMCQLFFLTYISSRVLLSKVIKRSYKDLGGYRYNGAITKSVLYYLFVWNIPLFALFSILQENLNIILKKNALTIHLGITFIIIFIVLMAMFYKSTRSNIVIRRSNYGKTK